MRRLIACLTMLSLVCCVPMRLQPLPDQVVEVQPPADVPEPPQIEMYLIPPGLFPHQVPLIEYSAPIMQPYVNATLAILGTAVPPGPDFIVLVINSGGGNPEEGLKLEKAIEFYPAPVVCIVDGEAASEAFRLLQSCAVRLMTARSRLMAHEPYYVLSPEVEQRMTRARIEQLRHDQDTLAYTWSAGAGAKLKIPLEVFRARIRFGDWWMIPDEALDVGAVDGVVPSVGDAWTKLQQTGDWQ